MALTNRIENAVIAAGTAVIVTALVMTIVHFMTIRPLQRQISKQNEVIVELAKIEKYHYEIRNDFEKIKPRDSQIIIDLDNKLEGLQINETDTAEVTPPAEVKKSFWRKLKFWK
jgi:preprotein translocase subunit YajC